MSETGRVTLQNVGVAVVGTGFMGPVHVEALRRLGIPVTGILGSTPEKSEQAAERLSLPRGYHSFEELLADHAVQSVHLGVPNRFHFQMVSQALEAGKHVLCEKPLAMNSRESAQLVKLAHQHPEQAAGVNYNIRYYPLCHQAAEMIRTGDLGNVFHITGSYAQDWLLFPTDYNWRVLESEGGELRAIADIGTHWLDLVYFLTHLEVESLCADLNIVHARRQRPRGEVVTFSGKGELPQDTEEIDISTEDYGAILLRFYGGTRGVVWVSQVSAGRKNCLRVEVSGSVKSLAWNSESPNEMWIGHRETANQVLLKDPSLLTEPVRSIAGYPGGHNEGYPDSFKQCFRSFYEYIAAGDFETPRPFPTFADGHREILLCEAIVRSHHEGRWVHVKGEKT